MNEKEPSSSIKNEEEKVQASSDNDMQVSSIETLAKLTEITKIPMRYGENGYTFRRKGEPHISTKTGEITIYFICLKCPKLLIFDWKTKSFKIPKKKSSTSDHSCSKEQHLLKKNCLSPNLISAELQIFLDEITGKVLKFFLLLS